MGGDAMGYGKADSRELGILVPEVLASATQPNAMIQGFVEGGSALPSRPAPVMKSP